MRLGFFTAFAIIFLLPLAASAQALGGVGSTDPFTISVAPQYPQPFHPITLSFLSSSLDLANTTLTLTVGGKQIYQGSVHPVTVMLGKAGSVTTLKATIAAALTTYSKSLTLQPEDVALIAEPISSAPVLYPGKPLVPLTGSTRVVAVATFADASGQALDPAQLSYTWTVDGATIADSSGIGKSAIIVASPLQYRDRSVTVTVQNQTGALVGGDSLSLAPVTPTIRVYENDPLLGVRFDHALLGSYSISGTESSLYAAPFSLPLIQGNPVVQWFLNSAAAQTGNTITLRPSGTGQGNASLSLTASGGTAPLATANLSLSFGAKPNSNFFGL